LRRPASSGAAGRAPGFAYWRSAREPGGEPDDGWTAANVAGTGLFGLALFVVLIRVELRSAAPMLNLRLLTDRLFRSANGVVFYFSAGYTGLVFLLPLYPQQLRGFSAFESGLTTFPQAIGVMLCLPFASRLWLYPRVGRGACCWRSPAWGPRQR